jgi:nitroreductase
MTRHPDIPESLHPLIQERWSPKVFDAAPLPDALLRDLFEAARWAPSSMNEQPWRFVLGRRGRGEIFERLRSTLSEGNEVWARHAPVLVLVAARTTFTRNVRPNRHAWHDTGLAVAQLILQATAGGLAVHPMGGFDGEAARSAAGLPEGFEPVVMLALGRRGKPGRAPAGVEERDPAARSRLPLSAILYDEEWGKPARFEET